MAIREIVQLKFIVYLECETGVVHAYIIVRLLETRYVASSNMCRLIFLSILLVIFVVVQVHANKSSKRLLVPKEVKAISGAPSGIDYFYIPFSLAVNRGDAEEACRAMGMTLAPIPSVEDLMFVGGMIKEEAWIRSFRGQFVNECVAAFRGGAIAVPVGECTSNHAVLCSYNDVSA